MGEHFYGPGGQERYDASMKEVRKDKLLPSVTTILGVINKYHLNKWKEDKIYHAVLDYCESHRLDPDAIYDRFSVLPEIQKSLKEELNKSAEQGALIHRQVEAFFKVNPAVEIPQELKDSLRELVMEHNIIVLEVEKTFANYDLGYGGKIDLLCEFDGELSIVDWKTKETGGKNSAQLYNEVPMQLAACAVGIEKPRAKLYTVVISRDEPGKILAPKMWGESERYYKAFQSAHVLWCAMKNYNPWTGGKWYVGGESVE